MWRVRGVTLVELLIALAIIAVLTGIGVVALQPPESRLLANDIKAQFEQARFEAIKRNTPVAVVWNADDEEFITVANTNDPRVIATCAGNDVLNRRSTQEYRSARVSLEGSRPWPGSTVWLPSGQGRTCAGSPAIGGEITLNDGRTTRVVEISVGGRVSIR